MEAAQQELITQHRFRKINAKKMHLRRILELRWEVLELAEGQQLLTQQQRIQALQQELEEQLPHLIARF
jgi:hypothetical protein